MVHGTWDMGLHQDYKIKSIYELNKDRCDLKFKQNTKSSVLQQRDLNISR